MKLRHAFAALALSCVAAGAWAYTLQDLQDEADRLAPVFQGLETQIDDCPGGTCSEAAQIRGAFDVAAGDLDQLAADRAALPNCSCPGFDADLADLEASRADAEDVIHDWT